jgi:predicted nicotinamide N-methyase
MGWSSSLEQHTVSDEIPLSIRSRFTTATVDHRFSDRSFRILTVRDPDTLLDAITPSAFDVDERLPYWAELWTSAIVLAERCIASPGLAGKRVLDLGCGLGLTGIAAAAAGAQVLFTDYEADALAFAEWNARVNLSSEELARCTFRTGDWRTPEEFGRCDVVLGADIVYERRNFSPLLACLRATVAPQGEAWLAEPDRTLGHDFFALARAEKWHVELEGQTVERRNRVSTVRIARLRPAGVL